MKHLKTFESFSYTSTEVVQEGIFGFGKPKDGEWTKNIEENFKLLKDGKLSKTSLEKRFAEYGESFGLGPDPKTGRYKMGQKQAPSVHNYLYEDGKAEDVKEDEFAKVHIDRCKAVKKENGKWVNDTLVGDGLTPGRKF